MIPGSGSSCWLVAAEAEYGRWASMDCSGTGQYQFGSPSVDGMVRPTPLIGEKPGTVRKAHDDQGGPDKELKPLSAAPTEIQR